MENSLQFPENFVIAYLEELFCYSVLHSNSDLFYFSVLNRVWASHVLELKYYSGKHLSSYKLSLYFFPPI